MEAKYDIGNIINKCENIEDKKEFISYVSEVLKEKQNAFLYQIYALYKKGLIIKTLEKTLKILNNGGIKKINCSNEEDDKSGSSSNEIIEADKNIRTPGGTFIYLIKTSDIIPKEFLKKIFYKNNKKKRSKKKLIKSFNKLNINN